MRFDVITLFPELVTSLVGSGVAGRALDNGLFDLQTWNPRDFTSDRHRTVDDRPFGGGPGMVMMVEPLRAAIQAAKADGDGDAHVICMSPQGRPLDQQGVEELYARERIILVSGRYEGIDERLMELEIDAEWSIGDYVLSGGELPAMVVIDAVMRLIPGALGDEDSAQEDSFVDGLLDCPHYTRPREMDGLSVPDVLLGGNHAAISRWRAKQSLGRTWQRRPELLSEQALSAEQQSLLNEYIEEHGSLDPKGN
ncbi:MAG TPA: tRNA (guanosine(37)-N1)-methyltransferase TrmD [Chromatiales bacterium]|jgi:tRNA (guanine37-N1)-methyltransferase|nr:tRNA (guanosine(37)-N1)-methyltransferase TrmD [Chromatiaceae bacterium]HIB84206.1 tRNA (guanosine(37)-N1)-methyltransferase TrmD [Chromatiaceae bacterium]HIN82032.1 tRNA (guanosine(37)-N1)-methyltransferase TrmD [Chromatiales bacterium]HIO13925.1 tRNA (guanosine(37)-N1)-methyltransferase TrmD [Chromatiales bacterium]HIO55322.1 tRNA (guanosine(37)-N1)-methyltransferase TrmD [Chromatiales bacterium]